MPGHLAPLRRATRIRQICNYGDHTPAADRTNADLLLAPIVAHYGLVVDDNSVESRACAIDDFLLD